MLYVIDPQSFNTHMPGWEIDTTSKNLPLFDHKLCENISEYLIRLNYDAERLNNTIDSELPP